MTQRTQRYPVTAAGPAIAGREPFWITLEQIDYAIVGSRSLSRGEMYRYWALLFVCTAAAFAGGAATRLAVPQFEQPAAPQVKFDEDIVLPMKVFVGNKDSVAARGTLSADWIAHKNNTYSFYCDREECIVASVDGGVAIVVENYLGRSLRYDEVI